VRVFTCDNCGQLVSFGSSRCLRCLSPLGYIHQRRDVVALTEVAPGRFIDLVSPVRSWRRCPTEPLTGCNWLVPAGTEALCESCALTRTRPADGDTDGLAQLVAAETAKRRLVFQLAELNLPVERRVENLGTGVAFDLLSSSRTKIITGHDDGVITLDLAEADPEHREHLRLQLAEPYRTLLGHFRHEIGHYYWPILVTGDDMTDTCRALFGDERQDYAGAVKRYYADLDAGEDRPWVDCHISRYATMHPFEDWAETFAHYLHILDTLQTASSFGIGREGTGLTSSTRRSANPVRPDGTETFGEVIDHWLRLSYGLNQINQSMGRDDLYPFVLAPALVRKMAFVDRVVQAVQAAGA
jgi:hypothetical protein